MVQFGQEGVITGTKRRSLRGKNRHARTSLDADEDSQVEIRENNGQYSRCGWLCFKPIIDPGKLHPKTKSARVFHEKNGSKALVPSGAHP